LAEVVVADAGPLIDFAHIRRLDLMHQVLGETLSPEAVLSECVAYPSRPGAIEILAALSHAWFARVDDPTSPDPWHGLLDAGESAAIRLARERSIPVLMDEKTGRRLAQAYGVPIVGSAGVLLAAKSRGLIGSVGPVLDQFRSNGYFLSDALVRAVLLRAGEART